MAAKPASVFVEAEGNDDSEEEGQNIAVDVWLSLNRITNTEAVTKKFTDRQITIEELLEFTETDLRSFCKELQFDTLTTTRIMNGVKSTLKEAAVAAPAAPANVPLPVPIPVIPDMNALNDGNIMDLPMENAIINNAEPIEANSVKHVIVSPQEHEAMEKMYRKYDIASTLSETIQKSYKAIEDSTALAKADLNEKFVLLCEQMKLRQEELTQSMDELKAYKLSALHKQSESLAVYRQAISQGKTEYERLISDANMDIHRRKMEIMAMLNGVIKENKVPLSLVTQPEIKFVMPPKAISTFLTALAIDNCDRPTPPILILEKVTFETMTVSWQTEFDSEDLDCASHRKASEFQLCFAKFTKEFILSKKDRRRAKKKAKKKQKKRKKHKRKKKHKKKKRKKHSRYSSSDSDSDSDSSSESSSDSDSDSSSEESDSDSSEESESDSGVDIDDLQSIDEEKKGMNEGDCEDKPFKNVDLSVLNWKKVRLSHKSKSHRIKGLVHGWSYLVRIRGKNESGYGEYSEPLKVSTKTINLIWNQNRHGKGLTFLSKNRCKFSSKQAKVCADYKIKSRTHKIFCWEYKMHKISNYSYIGFVRGPSKQYVSNWNYYLGGNNMNEYSIGFSSGARSLSIQNNGGYNHQQSVPLTKTIRSGDRFKFKANMKNKNVTVYHNGKNVGSLFQNIPSCIVPAASNNSSHMDISISFAN